MSLPSPAVDEWRSAFASRASEATVGAERPEGRAAESWHTAPVSPVPGSTDRDGRSGFKTEAPAAWSGPVEGQGAPAAGGRSSALQRRVRLTDGDVRANFLGDWSPGDIG